MGERLFKVRASSKQVAVAISDLEGWGGRASIKYGMGSYNDISGDMVYLYDPEKTNRRLTTGRELPRDASIEGTPYGIAVSYVDGVFDKLPKVSNEKMAEVIKYRTLAGKLSRVATDVVLSLKGVKGRFSGFSS